MNCIEKIRDIIVSEVQPDKIILFGSRARGDGNADSDYDILVLKRVEKYYYFCTILEKPVFIFKDE